MSLEQGIGSDRQGKPDTETLRWLESAGVAAVLGLLAEDPGRGLTFSALQRTSGLSAGTLYSALEAVLTPGLIRIDIMCRGPKVYYLTDLGLTIGIIVQELSKALRSIPLPPRRQRRRGSTSVSP